MRILLTNDDGIDSDGLAGLHASLAANHEVWVIAPEKEQSGTSHSISIFSPLRVRERAARTFAVAGTPADCVLLGIRFLIGREVDAVVAGINRGANLGTDILYSGTVAAARQGALMGRPSFAFSLCDDGKGEYDFENPARIASRLFERLIGIRSPEQFFNINFPGGKTGLLAPVITVPSERIYRDHYESYRAPDGSLYCFLYGDGAESLEKPGSDYQAVKEGKISVSPLAIHPVNHETEELYRKAFAEKEPWEE